MEGVLVVTRGPETTAILTYRLHCSPGDGKLHLSDGVLAKSDWRQSVAGSWQTAKRLTGQERMDGRLKIDTPNILGGYSAGASIGITATCELLGQDYGPVFATGNIASPQGFLTGGRAVFQKGKFLDQEAASRGETVRFIVPPIPRLPQFDNVEVVPVTDLGLAASLVCDDPVIEENRKKLMTAPTGLMNALKDPDDPFTIVTGCGKEEQTTTPTGVSISWVLGSGHPFAWFGAEGRLHWGTPLNVPNPGMRWFDTMWQCVHRAHDATLGWK